MKNYNQLYFEALFRAYSERKNSAPIAFGPVTSTNAFAKKFSPASVLSDKEWKQLPVTFLDEVAPKSEAYCESAKSLRLNVMKLLAGRGTSFSRERFLHYMLGDKCPTSSSKGLDLIVETQFAGQKIKLSIAELQVLQSLQLAEKRKLAKVNFQPLLSSDTADFISQLESKPFPLQPKTSMGQFLEDHESFKFKTPLLQEFLPTVAEDGELHTDYTAPGGHGFFAFSLLNQILDRVDSENIPEFHSISNGEDLNSSPNEALWGWMHDSQHPLVMITTTKTSHDLKGGQISLVQEQNESYVSILEQAQAAQVDESKYFEMLGLRPGDRQALFNTNTALFNEKALADIFRALLKRVTKSDIIESFTPDLIMNRKEVVVRGSKKTRIQLEGAMGSVLLNFDRFCRKILNKAAVHFLHVPTEERFNFFTPIKSALDYCLLFQSDLFQLNSEFRNVSLRPGVLQKIDIDFGRDDWSIKDLLTMWMVFNQSHIKMCDELSISGPVFLRNLELQGKIELVNEHNQALSSDDFSNKTHPLRFKNQRISKSTSGIVSVENL